MDQTQYTIAILQQQRNQALDALADALAQLNVMRDQLVATQAEIERLRSAGKIGFDRPFDAVFDPGTAATAVS